VKPAVIRDKQHYVCSQNTLLKTRTQSSMRSKRELLCFLCFFPWYCFQSRENAPKSKFSVGSAPDRAGGAYSTPRPRNWWGGCSLPPVKNPTPALGPSGIVYTGVRVTDYPTEFAPLLMIDFKCRPIWSSYFFRFWKTEKMDSVMKGLMGQCPTEFVD